MKLDYALRFQKKYKGDYFVTVEGVSGTKLPFPFSFGDKKLTKQGREVYKSLLDLEVDIVHGEGRTYNLMFIHCDENKRDLLVDFIWLYAGFGSIKGAEMIERVQETS